MKYISESEFYGRRSMYRIVAAITFFGFLVGALRDSGCQAPDLSLIGWLAVIGIFVAVGIVHMSLDSHFTIKDMEQRGMWYWEYLEKAGFKDVPNL